MQTTGTYAFDQTWRDEHTRLRAMEELFDSGTRTVIESLGIAPGWHVLEVGAGSGSIARWLANRVGPAGEVVATDITTHHLHGLDLPNVDVRQHDILADTLPSNYFDLIHTRLLVEHVGTTAIDRMASSLRPGGWLVIEDSDCDPACSVFPEDARVRRALDVLVRYMERSGFDPQMGRKLLYTLEQTGLEDVDADGRVRVYRGGSLGASFMKLSLQSLGPRLIASGVLTPGDVEHAVAAWADPEKIFHMFTMISAWGRKPMA